MVLVDNSAWIEWLIGSPIGETPVGQMPDRDEWLVPTMVQLEAAKWLAREADEHEEDQVIAFTRQCRVVPLTPKLPSRQREPVETTGWQPPMRSSTRQLVPETRCCSPAMSISGVCPVSPSLRRSGAEISCSWVVHF